MNKEDILYKTLKVVAFPLFSSLYRVKVEGKEGIPSGRAVLVPNHTSYLDPFYIIAGLNETRPIHFCSLDFCYNQGGVLSYFIDKLLRATGQIVLENGGLTKGGLRRIDEILGMDRKLSIFAEGRRSNKPQLEEFRQGASFIALRTNTPLVPIYMDGAYEIWPRTRRFPLLEGEVTLKIGKTIYPPRDKTKKDQRKRVIEDLSDRVRSEIERLMS